MNSHLLCSILIDGIRVMYALSVSLFEKVGYRLRCTRDVKLPLYFHIKFIQWLTLRELHLIASRLLACKLLNKSGLEHLLLIHLLVASQRSCNYPDIDQALCKTALPFFLTYHFAVIMFTLISKLKHNRCNIIWIHRAPFIYYLMILIKCAGTLGWSRASYHVKLNLVCLMTTIHRWLFIRAMNPEEHGTQAIIYSPTLLNRLPNPHASL